MRPGFDQSSFLGGGELPSPVFAVHRPVGELAVRPRPFGDRIDDELCRKPAGDDHRAPGEKGRPVDGAAPQHDAVPARRAFVGKQRLAHPGMDAVAADQHVAARGGAVAGAVEEIGGDAAFVLGIGAEPVAGVEAIFAEPRPRRLIDHAVQAAAMDRELRHVVAGVEPARLAPDLLAEAVHVEQLVGADRHCVEALQEAEPRKLLDGMRQRVDADAELAHRVGLLEHLAVDAAGMQHQRSRQPADAAADDERLHAYNSVARAADVQRHSGPCNNVERRLVAGNRLRRLW